MAVYTHISQADLRRFLTDYNIGELVSFDGITAGVENTNYLIQTDRDRFILTLFENRVSELDIPFFLDVMSGFSKSPIPAPSPTPQRSGVVQSSLKGRPAVITTFLEGAANMSPGPAACATFGATLANMHTVAEGLSGHRPNSMGPDEWRRLASACASRADECTDGLRHFIQLEIDALSTNWPCDLPKGIVHADLFPDNVFFQNGGISGVIDFYFSCTDFYAYDLAVALNAWSSSDGKWQEENAQALLWSYLNHRSLSKYELEALPLFLRGSALRFLLSRLYDWLNQVEGALVVVKNPLEYYQLLTHHQTSSFDWIRKAKS